MRPFVVLLLLILASPVSLDAQNKGSVISLIQRLPRADRFDADISATDTIKDIPGNYICYRSTGEEDTLKLFEAQLFGKPGGKQLLFVTRYSADMQCSFYHTSIFEYDRKNDTLLEKKAGAVFPDLSYSRFFRDSSVYRVAAKYIDSVRVYYLGKEATVNDMLRELYSLHFDKSKGKNEIGVTLHVCDYIPVNQVPIEFNDWLVFQTCFRPVQLVYNNRQNRFVFR